MTLNKQQPIQNKTNNSKYIHLNTCTKFLSAMRKFLQQSWYSRSCQLFLQSQNKSLHQKLLIIWPEIKGHSEIATLIFLTCCDIIISSWAKNNKICT